MSERACCDVWLHATPVGFDPSHPIQPLEIRALFTAIVLTLFTLAQNIGTEGSAPVCPRSAKDGGP